MAELEIDQSNLPRVREVCQCFAVLEDGVLAHNLQEQEIEQYYTSNVQKNQLVQNDIRVAKRLQDEEEQQWAQQTAIVRQTSRQLEEQDLEFARVIQDEIQRCAEEARRREMVDEEIARRLQEEEEQRIKGRSRDQEGHSEGSADDPALPSPQQHMLSSLRVGEQSSTFTTRWQYSTSQNHSDSNGTSAVSHREHVAHKNTASWSNQGQADSIRQIRNEFEFEEPLSEDSDGPDTVFSEHLSVWSQRWDRRLNTAPPQRQASRRHSQERSYRSLGSHNSLTNAFRSRRDESREYEDYYDNDHYDREIRRLVNRKQERSYSEEYEGWNRSRDQDRDSRLIKGRERQRGRSESVKIHDRGRHKNRDLVRTCSYKDNPDKHVHFQDDTRSSKRQSDKSKQVWEMLGQILQERGVPVMVGGNGAPLQIRSQRRDSQVHHGSEVSYCNSQPHQTDFQRAATTRHSFHGDIRKRRKSSYRESGGRDHREGRDRHCDNVTQDGEVYEISSRNSFAVNRERQGSRRWRNQAYTNDDESDWNANHHRVKGMTSERRHWHRPIEQRLSSKEEQQDVERKAVWPPRRAPQRSQSLSCSRSSTRGRPRHMSAGVSLQLDLGEASMDLGELQQVLQDEEIARKLQEEEENLLRRNSQPSPHSSYPEGDFRVAQVAQDEEIAHFMQKQEIKSNRRSRDLEGPASWREHRAMITHDRQATRERRVQRDRLDSEGLPSHTEDCSPENQPPSPVSTLTQAQHIRNIAEELDPTFQARRQDTERLQLEQSGPTCQSPPVPHSGVNDVDPAFIPPTKRQTEKSGRTKPKEKRENCKQQ